MNLQEGRPVVALFENGAVSGSYSWRWVAGRLPDGVTPLTYDRAASSLFDSVFRRMDYPSVLARVKERLSPYTDCDVIVIGHSIGGLLARAHANALGSRAIGLVLVDASPPGQFQPGVDHEWRYLRMNQSLLVHALSSATGRPLQEELIEDMWRLPSDASMQATALMRQPRYWMNAYRESRAAGSGWLSAALFPERESRPMAIVSSEISAAEHSMQDRFETSLLEASTNGRRLRAQGASHATVLWDEEHSRKVNEAIAWVLARARKDVVA
ncbi:MAG: alpha/beta hydrolase fold protein [Microbacterium sp.]|jgi:pimeloyl-ACP methyl ester carboxylesterase|uniref:alpha/beta fold hydrolase n=1 Tax=Microbacterium sp. TaxID=51671 RepID=UPI00260AEFDB|nr:alpha/beta hydrolase [Microbacterium sp.]MDF2562467.1 alpha/beta hydrolase fold protein [Microbacterium sp.]